MEEEAEKVLTAIHWTHGGNEVMLVGSFTGWKEYHAMTKEDGGVFLYIGHLPVGIHSYKFIVDGKWRYCPDQEQIKDINGNINNCIAITSNKSRSQTNTELKKHEGKKKNLRNHLLLPGVEEIHSPRRKGQHVRVSSFSNLETYASGVQQQGGVKLLLVMVGLPARGKSFISRKLFRYLNWIGYKSKIFNLGSYRREHLGSFHSHDWFRPDNPEGKKAREAMAEAALDDLLQWYQNDNGSVAIYDGTNSTKERRKKILHRIKSENAKTKMEVRAIFIEIICNDPETINANIRATKLSSPDYAGVNPNQVVKDFTERIEHYQAAYETVSKEENVRFIKIFDVGRQIVANRITGFVPGKIMFYLTNLHITPRPVYLARHGQSVYSAEGRIGGDTPLTPFGFKFAHNLREYILKEIPDASTDLCVWSSTQMRAVQTSNAVPSAQCIRWKALDDIRAGVCDGMTYLLIEEQMPEEYAQRQNDKLRYRYPRGESYEDVIRRVEPVIVELERQRKPILIVAHQATLRCLYSYFMDDFVREEVPHIDLPFHSVCKLQPGPYGTVKEFVKLIPTEESETTH